MKRYLVIILITIIFIASVLYFIFSKNVQPSQSVYKNDSIGLSVKILDKNITDYKVNESYIYQALGPEKNINGISFTIPKNLSTSTNLSEDSYISVEELPQAKNCTANIFLDDPNVSLQTITENNVKYSVSSSTGAGAGNRYEETVYAISESNPCIAIRYFIHYSVIENYNPSLMIKEFDKISLLNQFNDIRKSFVIEASKLNTNLNDYIQVITPLPNTEVKSPLLITGQARGNWYFEASFPVLLFDGNGKEIARNTAQAQSDWMTTDFVSFKSTLKFDQPYTATGKLILKNDNPSGLSQNDKSISIPVLFDIKTKTNLTGTLQGSMTIGPICPVERIDHPCLPTPEMFAIHKVFIYKSNDNSLIATLTPGANGKFNIKLPVGDYKIDTTHQTIGSIRGVPILIHINSNTSVNVDINVDTGIR